jgi:glucokinase
VTALIKDLSARQGLDPSDVPVCIGLPGMMRRDGRLVYAPNLRSASGADLGALLGASLSSSMVFCENDANCAALCEHEWGAARGIDDFVMVTLGTGIGGGVIADGKLIRGHSGFAGEIGHMVVEARGAACHCGSHGCWERYASGGGLNRMTREAAIEGRFPTLVAQRGNAAAVRAEDVTAAAAQNLDEAVVLMKEIGWWLALGLANLAAILDCGHFVIGGGLSIASDLVLPSAREYLADLVEGYAHVRRSPSRRRCSVRARARWAPRSLPSSERRETRRAAADVSKRRRRRAGVRRSGRRGRYRRRLRLRPPLAHGLTDAAVAGALFGPRGRRATPPHVIVGHSWRGSDSWGRRTSSSSSER